MPFTVNGCGTTYVGSRRNRTTRTGRCDLCGKEAYLRSYDTWHCICVVFVPVIPLQRFRIVDECSACRRHRRVPLAALERALAAEIEPLRARSLAGDLEAGRDIARACIRYDRYSRARDRLREVLDRHPNDPEANWLLGVAFTAMEEPAPATPFLEAAVRESRGEEKYLESLAYNLAGRREFAKAEALFRKLVARSPGHPPWLYQLAVALKAQGRAAEAADAFAALEAAEPATRQDPGVGKVSAEVKLAAGRDLTPAERVAVEAGRQGRRRRLIAAAAAGVLLAAGAIAVWISDRTVRVVVDNHADRPLAVRVDGAAWIEVPPRRYANARLPRGTHRLQASAGDLAEQFEIEADPPLLGNVFGSATFVCDPFRRGVYVDHEVVYGSTAPRPDVLHAWERWFLVPAVDDLFTEPPTFQLVEEGKSKRRAYVERAAGLPPASLAAFLLSRGRPDDAIECLETEAERGKGDPDLLAALAAVGTSADRQEAVAAWLAARRSADPSALHYHRMYQEVRKDQGQEDAVRREYDDLLAKSPGSAMAHYLRGRIEGRADGANRLYRAAIRLDPGFAWPHVALGLSLSGEGRLAEAIPEFREYRRLAGDTAEAREILWRALAEAQAWEALGREIAPRADPAAKEPDERALQIHGRLLLWRGAPAADWDRWQAAVRGRHGKSLWFAHLSLERRRWEGQAGAADPALAEIEKAGEPPAAMQLVRRGLHAAAGDWDSAERAAEAAWAGAPAGQKPVLDAAFFGIEAEWTGRADAARRWYERAAAERVGSDSRGIIRFLRGEISAAALAEGDSDRSGALRALSLVARALRTDPPAERERLLGEAERRARFDMTDLVFQIRGVLSKAAPKRP